MKAFRTISVLAAVCAASSVAMAGVHVIPTAPGMVPDPNNPGVWKTAPMSDGQPLVVKWAVHTKNVKEHWAGVRFRSHVWDPNEVSLNWININASGPPLNFPAQTIPGPTASVPKWATFWHGQAMDSGIPMGTSVIFTFGSWSITVAGTTPANNSDVDLTAWGSSIIHIGSQVSNIFTFFPDWYVWATSNFEPTFSEPVPIDAPDPGDPLGHWVPFGITIQHHITPAMGSAFVSKPIGNAGIGIEHIPAPGVALMMLAGGGGALLARGRAGRRRLA
jgi:hypothetical protein